MRIAMLATIAVWLNAHAAPDLGLAEDLELNDSQKKQIKVIRQGIEQCVMHGQNRILAILTPHQQEVLEARVADSHQWLLD